MVNIPRAARRSNPAPSDRAPHPPGADDAPMPVMLLLMLGGALATHATAPVAFALEPHRKVGTAYTGEPLSPFSWGAALGWVAGLFAGTAVVAGLLALINALAS